MKTLAEMQEELRRFEMQEPIVRNYAALQRYEGIPQEQALIGMVLSLAEKCNHLEKQYIEHMNRCTTPSVRL